MSVTVFIADDHPIFRRGLCEIIGEEEGVLLLGEAAAGDQALHRIAALAPDVAILDVEMPGMSGLETARAVRERGIPTPIILLTVHEDETLFHEAIDIGIQSYLLKEDAVNELVLAIRAVASGRTFFSPSVSGFLLERNTERVKLRKENPGLEQLTPAERRILKQITEDKTSKEIAAVLGISVRTVETHRQNISAKLGLRGSHSLVKFAFHHKSLL